MQSTRECACVHVPARACACACVFRLERLDLLQVRLFEPQLVALLLVDAGAPGHQLLEVVDLDELLAQGAPPQTDLAHALLGREGLRRALRRDLQLRKRVREGERFRRIAIAAGGRSCRAGSSGSIRRLTHRCHGRKEGLLVVAQPRPLVRMEGLRELRLVPPHREGRGVLLLQVLQTRDVRQRQ